MSVNFIDETQDEASMIKMAQTAMQVRRNESTPSAYYRSPSRRLDGFPYEQARWIGTYDSGQETQLRRMARGFIPLIEKHGLIQPSNPDRNEQPNAYDKYGRWGPILSTKEGVAEFPLSQIMAYNWYNVDSLRSSCKGGVPPGLTYRESDGMVLWPQLKGVKFRVYQCRECNHIPFNDAILFSRHLRNWHDYKNDEIITFGEQNGIDWSAHSLSERKSNLEYVFGDDPAVEASSVQVEEDPDFAVEIVAPKRGQPAA